MLKDGYNKNGYPAVVFMISNKKYDDKHPFSDELIDKEMDIIKKKYPFVAETVPANNADIVKIGQKLNELGYEAHLWLCGDDREAQFKRQTSNSKYRDAGHFPDDFTTYTGTGRTEGVSGTAVRNALKDGDRKKFTSLVPDGVSVLFDDMKAEIDNINESYMDINLYIDNYEQQHKSTKATIGDVYNWVCMLNGKSPELNSDGCRNLYVNGLYKKFDSVEQTYDFIKANFNKTVTICSDENDDYTWNIHFNIDGKTYSIDMERPYGEMPQTEIITDNII